MIICQNCGTELSDTAKFCRKCGTRIEIEPKFDPGFGYGEGAVPEYAMNQPVDEGYEAAEGTEVFEATARPDTMDAPVEVETYEAPAQPEAYETPIEPEAYEAPIEAETYETPVQPEAQEAPAETEHPFAAAQAKAADAKPPVFEGTDYHWGPPTGTPEDYDKEPMPPVYVGGAPEDEEDEETDRPYTYREEIPEWDHTADYSEDDISDNKVVAMAAYLLGPIGVIIALLAGQNSPYAAFHMRQSLKFIVVEALVSLLMVLLCWTVIVPVAGAIFLVILWVIKIITFISVCRGKAVEPAIIRSLKFMK